MTGKVFISCGQANKKERAVAKQLEAWFRQEGFIPYAAIQTQSINDVNSEIIANLENSDFYVYINFRRERISFLKRIYRGSLFTNQELAIAYYLKFDNAIFFEQEGIKRDGLISYMISNATSFKKISQVPELVKDSVIKRKWSPKYSRHLQIKELRWSQEIGYNDSFGNNYNGKAFNIVLANNRKDKAAHNTQIRLEFIERNGNKRESEYKSPLKCEGQPRYDQTIWPASTGSFSVLLRDRKEPKKIFLLSSLDVTPKPPIIDSSETYKLYFSILAENFPIKELILQIENTDDFTSNPKVAILNDV
jgi:hypothetical protein